MIVWTDRSTSVLFGTGEVHGQAVVEGDRTGRHRQEHRLDVSDLGLDQDVLRLTEEDVDELAHAHRVRAGDVAERAVLERRLHERDPRRDRVGFLDRPVRVVLVGVGLATVRFLDQRLVVPHAAGVDLHQFRRDLADLGVEGERRDVGAVLPQVHALQERLLVVVPLLQSGCCGCACDAARRW